MKFIDFESFCECCIYNGVELRTREHYCTNLESKNNEINEMSCPRWNNIKNTEYMSVFKQSYDFLNSHPAINCSEDTFFNNLIFWINPVCKRGIVNSYGNADDVYVKYDYGTEEFEKYKEYYGDEESQQDDCVYVPYRVVYGEDWKIDRYYCFGEVLLYRFIGDENKIFPEYRDYELYEGFVIKSDTYEKLIIDIAETVKKLYGDFNYQSFLKNGEKRIQYGVVNTRWWEWYNNSGNNTSAEV